MTGLFLACLGINVHLTDTYFVIAHFHFIMVGGTVMAYLGSIHYWWPKITGRLYSDGWGKIAAGIIFLGFTLTFLPQFVLGYVGNAATLPSYPPEFQVLNVLSTAGASILAVGYLLPLVYLLLSLRWGTRADANPWNAVGLEWMKASPPPTYDFDETPIVTWEAYQYDRMPPRVGRSVENALLVP
jgi:cytochrome c oxidase subunit 1